MHVCMNNSQTYGHIQPSQQHCWTDRQVLRNYLANIARKTRPNIIIEKIKQKRETILSLPH